MNLYHLKYFATLAQLEHYTKAAQALSITQPSLSYAISSLEEELGVKLFKKSGRNITLTKYGMTFYRDVEMILDRLENSVSDLKYVGEGGGRMDIAFVRVLGARFVPAVIRRYQELHPDKKITTNFHGERSLSKDILQGIKDQKYDIAFCSKIDNEPLIEFTPIIQQELVLIVPKDHPLAACDSVDLRETLPYDFITFKEKSGLRGIIDGLYKKIGAKPHVVMELDEDQVVAGFVSQNFGIAIVPRMYILNDLPVKALHITEPVAERYFYMATLKGSYMTPLVESFRSFIINEVAQESQHLIL